MKKITALTLAILALLTLASGCMQTAEKKTDYEVTVFVESALGDALIDIATAYTNAEINPNANEASEILFAVEDADAIAARKAGGAYCDVYISSEEATDAKLTLTGADGTVYSVSIVAGGDNPDATQAFVDYLKSDKAAEIFTAAGFTVS